MDRIKKDYTGSQEGRPVPLAGKWSLAIETDIVVLHILLPTLFDWTHVNIFNYAMS